MVQATSEVVKTAKNFVALIYGIGWQSCCSPLLSFFSDFDALDWIRFVCSLHLSLDSARKFLIRYAAVLSACTPHRVMMLVEQL